MSLIKNLMTENKISTLFKFKLAYLFFCFLFHSHAAEQSFGNIHLLRTSQNEVERFIRIGSTKDEVASIQGTPVRIRHHTSKEEEYWYFVDGSEITFINGCVREWNNYGCLKVKLHSDHSSLKKQPANTSKNSVQKQQEVYKDLEPTVAENGTYKGEISEKTGRPKNTHVPGYYRKNGTYVRGHYRS